MNPTSTELPFQADTETRNRLNVHTTTRVYEHDGQTWFETKTVEVDRVVTETVIGTSNMTTTVKETVITETTTTERVPHVL